MLKQGFFQFAAINNNVLELFKKESDRAAVVLAASYLEVVLEHLLRIHLINNSVVDDLFKNGPLSTFSSRINLSYGLGLIPEHIYHDLTLIRRIRNHFAHNMEEASFQESTVRDRCTELSQSKLLLQENITDARFQFLINVQNIALKIFVNSNPERFPSSTK